ncbi:D-alanyl-D-alanine carboxypeptidase [Streptomyces sp. NPDC002790]|uniref:D-alanyl-D-alanine carboxypeptidase n=1 Tax=Streptomyces sp. NPDC002790 TaxID=3154431 RepID=UPI00332706BE
MAGTPDRAGEHKASGGPAPEDPRLAVSRERSGVDRETGSSTPDPDAGDERLRAAVAAWVSGDDGPAETSAVANPPGASAGGAGSDGASDTADTTSPPEPDSDDESDAEPVAEGDGEPTADAETGPQDDARPTSEADAKSGAQGDGKPAATGGNKSAETAAAEAEADSDAKGDGTADAEPDAEADAKPDGQTDAKPDAKPAAEADAKSGAVVGAEPDAEAGAESDAEADAKSDAEADAKSGVVVGARPDGRTGAKPDAEAGAESDAEADAKSDGQTDAKPDGHTDAKPDAKPAAEADAKSGAVVGARPDGRNGAEPDAEAGAESDAEADAKPNAEADAKPDAKSGAKPDGKSGAEGDAKPHAEGDVKPDAKSGAKADAKPDAKSGAAADVAADAKSDGTSDADADAKADAKSDAKSGPGVRREGGGPVDQETAVFKAVSQPVDQPTTTLKAAGTAKSSKFVPLKGLEEGKVTGKELPPEAEQPTVEPAERTTQQPLPPKPPLDLLAELTNTPPPAETRVRTAVRRVKVWTPLVILLIIVFGVIQAVRPLPTPSLSLTTDATYSFDGDKASLPWPGEGQGWMDVQGIGTMDNFGKQTPVPIGSVAKSMTAYIVLKDHPLKAGADGPGITVDATAEKEGGYDADGQNESTLNTVKEGDKISQKDALAAVMIPSANNIARLLARWDAGSEEAFVKKMNATAKKLGMKNTTYTDPSGLKETTVSTAEDQVKLGNELVQIPALTDITKLPTWTDPSGKKWTNYNRLVPYDGAIGIKTGTTTKAGGNLLFAATKDAGGSTVTVVGAVLGQHKAPIIDTVNAVSKTAMLAAQDAVTSSTVLKKGDVVGYVDDQLGGRTPVTVTKDVKAVGWAGKTVHLQLADQDGKSVPHTGKAGETVGVLEVGDGEGGAVEVPVALQKGLTEPGFGAKLTRVG